MTKTQRERRDLVMADLHLFHKTELKIGRITLNQANLSDISNVVADTLGIEFDAMEGFGEDAGFANLHGSGCRVYALWHRVQGVGCRVQNTR